MQVTENIYENKQFLEVYEEDYIHKVNLTDDKDVAFVEILSTPPTYEVTPVSQEFETIRISTDGILNENLYNFQLLIKGTFDLVTKSRPDGKNLFFTNISNELIPYEIIYIKRSSGFLVAYVKVDLIVGQSLDIRLHRYMKQHTAESPSGLWSQFCLVHRASSMKNNLFGVSSKNVAMSSDIGVPKRDIFTLPPSRSCVGKLSWVHYFEDRNCLITYGSGINYNPNPFGSLSAWIYLYPNAVNQWAGIVDNGTRYSLVANEWELRGCIANKSFVNICNPGKGIWSLVAINKSGVNINFYLNGVYTGLRTVTDFSSGDVANMLIGAGRNCVTPEKFTYLSSTERCRIDEVRVSNVSFSAEWFRIQYLNQNDPGAFFEVI